MTSTPRRPQPSAPRPIRGRLVAALLVLGLALSATLATPSQAAPSPGWGSTERGRWTIRDLGAGRYAASWTSPVRLPITSDRPTITGPAGVVVGAPTVGRDGRTVTAVVTAPSAPSPASLDVTLSGAQLDRVDQGRTQARPDPEPAQIGPRVTKLAADPGQPGPYRVVTSDYQRTAVKVAGMAEPIEMVGHVVEPAADAATGPRPLVLFLHGRHAYCYRPGSDDPGFDWPCRGADKEIPSHLGYDYIQRRLASQGFTTVSVRVNGINAQDYALDDGGAGARATIVAKHLDYWATIAAAHQVDLSRVVLVGHSRGGEGVDRASIRIPLTAPYRIVGQVLIAPTDFGWQTAPYVPTVTLLPYCDGDVSDLQGQHFTDVSRDLAGDDTSLKSSVLVMGANHNFFNSEWTPGLSVAPSNDDWYGEPKAACGTATPSRLTAAQQRAVGRTYVAGAVRQFVAAPSDAQPFLPLFDGSAVTVDSIGTAVVRSHAIGGGRDVRRPSRDTSLTLPQGATSAFCTGSTSDDYRPGVCGSELYRLTTPHWSSTSETVPTRKFWAVGWTAAGRSAGLQLSRDLDLRDRTLDLRTIVDPARGDASFRIRLTDSAGRSATLTPSGGSRLRVLLTGPGVTKLWAQTVRVDAAGATTSDGAALDLAQIARVDVVGVSTRGRLWIADLAAAPDRVPATAARRLPAVSIGSATVTEGDRTGWTVAQVPFRLSSPMTAPGQFHVVTAGEDEGSLRRFTVDLAVGQTSGTIPVGYQSDTIDDPATSTTSIAVWAGDQVMTDTYLGRLVVRDDDPTPKVTIRRIKTTVEEGGSAQWEVTLAQRVDYPVSVTGTVVRGPGTPLSGVDVPSSWLSQHSADAGSTKPLDELGVSLYAGIRPGISSAILSIPIREDGKKEGKESVTLRVEALNASTTQTVVVAASP